MSPLKPRARHNAALKRTPPGEPLRARVAAAIFKTIGAV